VDAAGPFQGASLHLAKAAIVARSHYIDLADARDFVAAIPRLDAAAREANVLLASGASTTPALSHAALDQLVAGWRGIDRIEVAISPGNRQPRGLSVVQAILASAGRPIRVFRDGGWKTATGMSMLTRRRMPGLGRRWLFLVETPDLDLIPERFMPRKAAIVRAGLELGLLHLGVWALSKLVAAQLLPSLVPLARPLRAVAEWFRPFGHRRGGMTVDAVGIDAVGQSVSATWSLSAEQDGPNVPVLPALALIRALAARRIERRGAMACVGLLSLADINQEFARFGILTRTSVAERALFRRALGSAFDDLPAPIRHAHEVADRLLLAGQATIEPAPHAIGRLIARLIGFPATASEVPVSVEMRVDADDEIWTRTFGTARFASRLSTSTPGRVRERFGPLAFDLELAATGAGLDLVVIAARIGFVRLPAFLTPQSFAKERIDGEGRFHFDVPVSLPVLGLLVHYRGWLVPSTDTRRLIP